MALIDTLMDTGSKTCSPHRPETGPQDHCSFPRQSDSWHLDAKYRSGEIELELVPQCNLSERIRAAGASTGTFFTPTGYGTQLARGKETRMIEARRHVLELPPRADYALIKGDTADRRRSPQKPGLSQDRAKLRADHAPAATTTVVKVERIVDLGQLDPEHVVTPGIYVDRLVSLQAYEPISVGRVAA